MNSRYLATIAIMAVVLCTAESGTLPDDKQDLREISSANSQFSSKMFQTAVKNDDSNFICSPLSVSVVLSMAMFGARDETQKMMRSTLGLPMNDATVKKGFESLIEKLNSMKKVELRLANKIFTRTGFEVNPEFEQITATNFKSKSEMVDFSNAQAASQIIDSWCQAQTNNRIKDIVKPDQLKDAAMVLVNAVYFKGQWKKKFRAYNTVDKPFYIDEKNQKDIPMMQQTSRMNYGTLGELNAEFVELPYMSENEDDEISMMIIVPRTITGLKTDKNDFDKLDLSQLSDSGYMTQVELSLPKFRIESTINLVPILEELGMGIIFSNAANFSGISENVPLKISKVVQKAFIEVNEEGSEAAAVTGMVAVPMSMPMPPPDIKVLQVDRPFMYAIIHKATKTVLFQGRFTTP